MSHMCAFAYECVLGMAIKINIIFLLNKKLKDIKYKKY